MTLWPVVSATVWGHIFSKAIRVCLAAAAVTLISAIYLTLHLMAVLSLEGVWSFEQHGVVQPLIKALPPFLLTGLSYYLPFLIILAIATEYFCWRKLWIYVVLFICGAASSLPFSFNAPSAVASLMFALIHVSGAAAGFVYWLIAGQTAGFGRERSV